MNEAENTTVNEHSEELKSTESTVNTTTEDVAKDTTDVAGEVHDISSTPSDKMDTEAKVVEDKEDVSKETPINITPTSTQNDVVGVSEDDEPSDEEDSASEIEFNADYDKLSMKELLEEATKTLNLVPRESLKRLQMIRTSLDGILNAEKKKELEAFIAEGGEPESFKSDLDLIRKNFNEIYTKARDARTEEKKRIEEEKQANLKKKQALLIQLKDLISSDETEESIKTVKDIQKQWREVRIVPQEFNETLWEEYSFLLDKFYDNHSINIELKELDRKKNLETKIELCKKVDELIALKSLKKSFILLNKYHEEYRNAGPVPREFREEIWNRFKAASDAVRDAKKEELNALDEVRKENLKQKELLVDKVRLISEIPYKKVKDWKVKTDEVSAIFKEWKTIGPVPSSHNESVWKTFRGYMNTFYDAKSEYFKQLTKERKANLILKEDLCKQAEALLDNEDFKYVTKQLLKLQEEWKTIGPVPDKVSQSIWKRFRSVSDTFFSKKKSLYEGRKNEEEQNKKAKEALIEKVKALHEVENDKDVFDQLKDIQKEWSSIGFVPFKSKKAIQTSFDKSVDFLFNKFKKNRESAKAGRLKEHYTELLDMPNGKNQLKDEANKVRRKMKFLQNEVATWENNIQFFSMSSGANADKLKADIQKKIDKSNQQISRLKQEVKLINDLINPKMEKPKSDEVAQNASTE